MTETVSKPNHHSDKLPTREEKDSAFSNSGGRKAIEEQKDQIENESLEKASCEEKTEETEACGKKSEKKSKEANSEAPIGLDNETRAQAS